MTTIDPGTGRAGATTERTAGGGRFGAAALLGLLAVVVGIAPFLLLWLLVQRAWPPLAGLDGDVAAGLNEWVSASPVAVDALRYVTDLGGHEFAVLVFALTTTFLLLQGHRRLAVFTAVTGLGMAVLGPVTKAVVDRARPVVELPVVDPPSNASFPSGHALTSLVTWGLLLLLTLPAVRPRVRPWLVAGAALVVLAVGFSRLALGVHYVSDVLAGWALGVAWLAVTTLAFRAWQHRLGVTTEEPADPLEVPRESAPHLTSGHEPRLPTRHGATRLGVLAGALWLALSGLGLLVVGNDTWLGRLDRAVVARAVDLRSDTLTAVAELVGSLADTRIVVAVALTAAVLGAAVTGSRRPVVLVVVAVVGELLLYVGVSQVVGRMRPEVENLISGLPGGASWPSGHTAAAVVVYGAVAALVVRTARSRWRWLALGLPLILGPAVGLSRIYVAAHYPTDVIAGLLLGAAWVVGCIHVLLPENLQRHRPARSGTGRAD
jgi:membrane-associated phospholipid phosphatase